MRVGDSDAERVLKPEVRHARVLRRSVPAAPSPPACTRAASCVQLMLLLPSAAVDTLKPLGTRGHT
jgi:hypothetical protein